jgi:hypothetical protein
MPINWEDFDNNIKNTKYPLILIKNFFSSLEKINDNYATIMLRYIIKNNLNIFIDNPFYVIGKKISSKTHPNTLNILLSFYDLLKLKIKILNQMKDWFNSYENVTFWNKNIEEQIIDLQFIKTLVQSNFDTSKGGMSFGIKMIPIIKANISNSKEQTIISAADRLRNIFTIMGKKFFVNNNLQILLYQDFCELEDDDMIKYTNSIYLKVVGIITENIDLFENYNMINLKLENLINPYFVDIEEDNTNDNEEEEIIT